jgi:putative transposase
MHQRQSVAPPQIAADLPVELVVVQLPRFPFRGLAKWERLRLRAAQLEAARVWMYSVERHRQARVGHLPWPGRKELQEETKSGQFALHSQPVQMVTHQSLADVATIAELRKTDRRHHYPYHLKTCFPVQWPAQAISRNGSTLILPMGRGRHSLTFHLAGLPKQIGAASLVWKGGYELHVVSPSPATEPPPSPVTPAQATVDLGEIHLAAVITNTGQGLIVTGRAIRAVKRQHAMSKGEIQRKMSRCTKGSRRYRKLCYALGRIGGQTKRQVRDLRHKATRQVVAFCRQEGVQTVFIGNPGGVRKQNAGRHHYQRMARWEYGKDKDYLRQKCQQVHVTSFTGSERETSSQCPACARRKKPSGRIFACRHCGFGGHRDIVGSMNMHPLAFGLRISYPISLTCRRPGPARVRQRDEHRLPVARAGTS